MSKSIVVVENKPKLFCFESLSSFSHHQLIF